MNFLMLRQLSQSHGVNGLNEDAAAHVRNIASFWFEVCAQ
jgi:hypothetical protein